LLIDHRQIQRRPPLEPLHVELVLAWADAHRAATGRHPHGASGPVCAAPFLVTWAAIDVALRKGSRGMPGGSSLSCVLAEHRGE
jgi:hypothetical protein